LPRPHPVIPTGAKRSGGISTLNTAPTPPGPHRLTCPADCGIVLNVLSARLNLSPAGTCVRLSLMATTSGTQRQLPRPLTPELHLARAVAIPAPHPSPVVGDRAPHPNDTPPAYPPPHLP